MNYTVDWSPQAQGSLAATWIRSSDRNAVNAAQLEIDDRLSIDPIGNGSHLLEGLYAIEVTTLASFVRDSRCGPYRKHCFAAGSPLMLGTDQSSGGADAPGSPH